MKSKKRIITIALMAALLLGAGLSWAATSATGSLGISSGSTASGGAAADVTQLSDTFTITQGKAQKIAGVELFRIDLGNASYYDKVKIRIMLLDPEDISAVLNNPNAYINMQVCYEVDSGQDYTLNDETTKVKVDTSTSGMITKESGDIILMPTTIGSVDTDTCYILGSITTPGGVPPGQQTQLTQLQFYCEVRL